MEKKKYLKNVTEMTFYGMFGIVTGMWIGYIVMDIIHGQLRTAFDGIVMATLCVLCYVATKRMERLARINAVLTAEVQRLEDIQSLVEALRDIAKKDRTSHNGDCPRCETRCNSECTEFEGRRQKVTKRGNKTSVEFE